MTWVDYCILAITLLSLVVGLLRGFTREILSLLTWVSAFAVAIVFGDRAQSLLASQISDQALRTAVASGLLFVAVLLVGSILTHVIAQLVRGSMFSAPDRTLGAGVGVLRALAVTVLFVLIAGRLGAAQDIWWQQSYIVPRCEPLARSAEAFIPDRWLAMITVTPPPESAPSSSHRDS